jgi:N-acetylglutamate synthase-like GNAT family acetyltransferase
VAAKPDADSLLFDRRYIQPYAQGQDISAAVLAQVFETADAQALPVRVGALRGSKSNDFYVRHGFQRVEQAEFDNHYVRPSRQT